MFKKKKKILTYTVYITDKYPLYKALNNIYAQDCVIDIISVVYIGLSSRKEPMYTIVCKSKDYKDIL